MTQETHAEAMREITELTTEGAALLEKIGTALQDAAGADLARYVVIRKRLNEVMADAGRRGFPLSAASLAARKTRAQFDQQLAQVLAPVEKMLR